ncbi:MAG: acyltransferase family protein [Clostridia bacterium]|nr:acyltransferase family protein [Clostridia bacterium]
MQQSSTRLICYDRLRIFAGFCMVVMHVSAQDWYALAPATAAWQMINLCNGLTRFCVPVFMMLSGVFFLDVDRPCPSKKLFGRHVLRMVLAYLFWSSLYAVGFGFLRCEPGEGIVWSRVFHDAVYGHYHLWFVLTMIGFYLTVPLLRCICRERKTEEYFILLAVLAVFVVNGARLIPPLSEVVGATLTKLHLEFVLGCTVYFVLGHYLGRYTLSAQVERGIMFIGMVVMIGTIALTGVMSAKEGTCNAVWYGNLMPNTALIASAIFLAFKRWGARKPKAGFVSRLISQTARLIFGVYLVHDFFIELLRTIGFSSSSFLPILATPLAALCVFILSLAVTRLLAAIPIVNLYLI